MSPKISVIVPVYKAEKYLHRCIDSILAQTFTDFEVLLIDDGSPDKSGEICDEYAKKDPRVRVFHKENGGVSSARQCGIDNAQGEYTIHADPDDWVEPNMLEELYAKAKEDDADMVICDYIYEKKTKTQYCKQEPSEISVRGVLIDLFFQRLHGSCWNKLIRTSFCNNVHFPINVNLWEDLWFNCELLLYASSISYLPKAFYHYDLFSNDNSIVRNMSKDLVEAQIAFCKYFEEKIRCDLLLNKALQVSMIRTKELMFASCLYPPEVIVETFQVVNIEYVLKRPNFQLQSHIPFCLYLTLKGRWNIANKIHRLLEFSIKPILRKIIYKVWL